jgi:hypothetical protein
VNVQEDNYSQSLCFYCPVEAFNNLFKPLMITWPQTIVIRFSKKLDWMTSVSWRSFMIFISFHEWVNLENNHLEEIYLWLTIFFLDKIKFQENWHLNCLHFSPVISPVLIFNGEENGNKQIFSNRCYCFYDRRSVSFITGVTYLWTLLFDPCFGFRGQSNGKTFSLIYCCEISKCYFWKEYSNTQLHLLNCYYYILSFANNSKNVNNKVNIKILMVPMYYFIHRPRSTCVT